MSHKILVSKLVLLSMYTMYSCCEIKIRAPLKHNALQLCQKLYSMLTTNKDINQALHTHVLARDNIDEKAGGGLLTQQFGIMALKNYVHLASLYK